MNASIRFPEHSVSPYPAHTHTQLQPFLPLLQMGGELIKAAFDMQGDILPSNHDRGSQIHTLSRLPPLELETTALEQSKSENTHGYVCLA